MPSTDSQRSASRFLLRKANDGYDTSLWDWTLRAPLNVKPGALIEMARSFDCEVGDLLSAGFGRNNTYDDIDLIVSRSGQGNRLGVIANVA